MHVIRKIALAAAEVLLAAAMLGAAGCVNIDIDARGLYIPGLTRSDGGGRSWSYQATPLGARSSTTSGGVSVETETFP